MKSNSNKQMLRKRNRLKKNLIYTLLGLPAMLWLLFFHYAPFGGIILAFKNYNHRLGIFGSEWIGLDNFKFFFQSIDAFRVIRNTVGYGLLGMIFVNLLGGIIVAVSLYEITSKSANKLYQTSMLVPNFVSYAVVAYVVLLLLNPEIGIVNQMLNFFGHGNINWYNESKYWPVIIVMVEIWKNIGMASLYYYAALLGIDSSLFEAASLDGAGKIKQIWYISLPELIPMACLVIITRLGAILNAGFDLYYQVPMNSGALYSTTDVISTYVYRGLVGGDIGASAAVGLFQGVVGLVLVIASNSAIKKISPESAMF